MNSHPYSPLNPANQIPVTPMPVTSTPLDSAPQPQAPVILPSKLGPTAKEAAKDIFARFAEQKDLFQRSGQIVEVATVEGKELLMPVAEAEFVTRLERLGSVKIHHRNDDGTISLVPAQCPLKMARVLLASQEARDLLPKITLVSSCPVLVRKGDEVVELHPGWNPDRGGIFVSGSMPALPEIAAHDAWARLDALLVDFGFTYDQDRLATLAAIMTPALRSGGLLKGPAPLFLFSADHPGAGKSLLTKMIVAIYGDQAALVSSHSGRGVGSFDEAISRGLAQGRSFLQLDNLRGKLDSPLLEAAITADGQPVDCRVIRGAYSVTVDHVIFLATSNEANPTHDLADRTLMINLRRQPNSYVFHSYSEGGLLEHVRAHQPLLLACVHSLIREWAKRGFPTSGNECHRMQAWAATLGGILAMHEKGSLTAGRPSPHLLACRPTLEWLRELAGTMTSELTSCMAASELITWSNEVGVEVPFGHLTSDVTKLARQAGTHLKKLFAHDSHVMWAGCVFVREMVRNERRRVDEPIYRLINPARGAAAA